MTQEEERVILASSASPVFEWHDLYLSLRLAGGDHRRAVLCVRLRDAAQRLRATGLRGDPYFPIVKAGMTLVFGRPFASENKDDI